MHCTIKPNDKQDLKFIESSLQTGFCQLVPFSGTFKATKLPGVLLGNCQLGNLSLKPASLQLRRIKAGLRIPSLVSAVPGRIFQVRKKKKNNINKNNSYWFPAASDVFLKDLLSLGFQPPLKQWVEKYHHHCWTLRVEKSSSHWVNHYFKNVVED